MRCQAISNANKYETRDYVFIFTVNLIQLRITATTENGGAMNCRRDANLPIACTRKHAMPRISIIFIVVIVVCVPNGHKFVGGRVREYTNPNKHKTNAEQQQQRHTKRKKINPNIYVIGCVVSESETPVAHTHNECVPSFFGAGLMKGCIASRRTHSEHNCLLASALPHRS